VFLGAATVLHGGTTGVSAAGSRSWTQNSPGTANAAQAGHGFAAAAG